MKKLHSLLIALAAIMALPTHADADELTAGDNVVTINVDAGQSLEELLASGNVFNYTAPSTGEYVFTSSCGGGDPYGYLYDEGEIIAQDDDGAGDFNFTFTVKLQGGKTYQLAIHNYGSSPIENFTINIVAPHDGPHTMVKVDRVEATCTADGNIEYYQCTQCSQCFTDADGTNEVDNIVLPMGHKFEGGTTCTLCGLTIKTLQLGESTMTTALFTGEATIKDEYPSDNLLYYKVPYAGWVTFKCIGSQVVVFDGNGAYITFSQDGEPYRCYVGAGSEYWFGIKESQKTVSVHATAPHLGDHSLTQKSAVPATCTINGTPSHYRCTLCDKQFLDAAGTTETTADYQIVATGHNFGADDVCANCGETKAATMLSIGHNSVAAPYSKYYSESETYFPCLRQFTAPASGTIKISTLYSWHIAYMHDSQLNVAVTGGLSLDVVEGETYTFGFVDGANDVEGPQDVRVLYVSHEGDCVLTPREAVTRDCYTDGLPAGYDCALCDKHYDESLNEIEPLPATGHDMENGGCKNGCGLTAIPLELSTQNLTITGGTSTSKIWDGSTDNLYYFQSTVDNVDLLLNFFEATGDYGCHLYDRSGSNITSKTADQANWAYYVNMNDGDICFVKFFGPADLTLNVSLTMGHSGDHTFVRHEATSPTCTEGGNLAYDVCTICGDKFKEDGNPVYNTGDYYVDPLDHELQSDGSCSRCSFQAQQLQLGKNTISNLEARQYKVFGDELFGNNLFIYTADATGIVSITSAKKQAYFQFLNLDLTYRDNYVQKGESYIITIFPSAGESLSNVDVDLCYNVNHDEEHELVACEAAKEPTCVEDGYESGFVCNLCGTHFSGDPESGIYASTIPALGHDMHNGHCTRSGCTLTKEFPEITLGTHDFVALGNDTFNDDFENHQTNMYYFIPPVSGELAITNEGNNILSVRVFSAYEEFWWCNVIEVGGKSLLNLEEGKSYFISFNRPDQQESPVSVFLYMPQEGDLNHDGKITAADVTCLVDKILKQEQASKTK